MKLFLTIYLCVGLLLTTFAQEMRPIRITNDAYLRTNSIVQFRLEPIIGNENLYLVDKLNKKYAIQFLKDGYACAIMSLLPNEVKDFKVVKELNTDNDAKISLNKDEAMFMVKGKQVISLQTGNKELPTEIDPVYRRGGYIFPVLSPSGLSIADDYPLDHKHHHGIWAAWTKTEFEGRQPDFWNMADKTGTVLFDGIKNTLEGSVFAYLESRNIYYDQSVNPNKKVLNEDWQIKVYNISDTEKPYYLFDLELRQNLSGTSTLKLPEYRYGGLGFRGNGEWNGEGKTTFLSSEGKDRTNGHATSSKWIHIGGKIGEKLGGIAILSHPDNFRSPQPMRIHPSEPFFCYAPSQAGDFEIRPGETYVAQYRFIVYDGAPDVEFINNMWDDYANKLIIK